MILKTTIVMRIIQIDKRIEMVASKYQKLVEDSMGNDVKDNLRKLQSILKKRAKKKLSSGPENCDPSIAIDYIQRIIDYYDKLLTLHPSEFDDEIAEFEKIIKKNDDVLDFKVSATKGDKKVDSSLANEIVKAMKYSEIRKKIYPKVTRQLKIKTCVYCNANYTITDANGRGYYDLDHWKPKSRYPFLCTSFYNLQPSCPSCNRRKGKDNGEYLQLWKDTDDNVGLDVFNFQLEPDSIIAYLLNLKIGKRTKGQLIIDISEASDYYKTLVNNSLKRFQLKKRYEEHVDVAEEIVWKRQIYNDSYLASTEGLLREIYTGDRATLKSIRDRFILGNYGNPEEVHMRPLAKMTQDIAKQLGLL